MSKIKISEIFYSAQGEGQYVGVPSIFMRTFGCNFTCSGFGLPTGEKTTEIEPIAEEVKANPDKYKLFEQLPLVHTGCDSYASWHPSFKDFSPMLETDAIVHRMLELTPNGRWQQYSGNPVHLVITGGEPLLGWQRAYPDLLNHPGMEDLDHITFETNGTQPLSEEFEEFLQEWMVNIREPYNEYLGRFREVMFSISPKLSVSGETWADAIKPEVVTQYQNIGTAYLKFVVDKIEDFVEVQQAVDAYRNAGFMGRVYVMPVGGTVQGYNSNRVHVADEALKRGFYYSPRLHVDLWGNGWGK